MSTRPDRMPTGFVGHGNPMNALGGDLAAGWGAWGRSLGTPEAVVVVSAHFEAAPPTLSSVTGAPLVYDFFGFPEEMYRLDYSPPPSPAAAEAIIQLLGPDLAVAIDPDRGLDHGAWVPLSWMFPEADVPVVQLSIPWTNDPGASLAWPPRPLRWPALRCRELRAGSRSNPVPSWRGGDRTA